jgi:hypothetical protein
MKKLVYLLLMVSVPMLTFAASNEFSYDKEVLSNEFSQLDKVANLVDETNVTYDELLKTKVFEGNLELTNQIAVKPNFELEDMDWLAFGWGFCCCPVGFFLYMIPSRDKSQEEKTSYWIGVAAGFILSAIGSGGYYVSY